LSILEVMHKKISLRIRSTTLITSPANAAMVAAMMHENY